MKPSALYQLGVSNSEWQFDEAQFRACHVLDRIHSELIETQQHNLWDKLRAHFSDETPVRGLYLWGSVGRGKTFLTDLLIESLPAVPHKRWHFHRFMVEMHARMRALPDTSDTLRRIAHALRQECRLLVLDEFFVTDIADAMILGRLFERLIAEGVCVVTTSNIEPSGLYKDGLQRARFLPTIAMVEQHCEVHKLESAQDYRTRQLMQAAIYLTPLNAENDAELEHRFHSLRAHTPLEKSPLIINERTIQTRLLAEGMALFEFSALCETARSAADYVEIARDFHTVFLAGVPTLSDEKLDAAQRFVYLVDEFYDRNVNLILTATAQPTELYQGIKLQLAMARTVSRLIEMQSEEYLHREHRP
jgi:cell division protein ZapE